jgi:hypothetical protein
LGSLYFSALTSPFTLRFLSIFSTFGLKKEIGVHLPCFKPLFRYLSVFPPWVGSYPNFLSISRITAYA